MLAFVEIKGVDVSVGETVVEETVVVETTEVEVRDAEGTVLSSLTVTDVVVWQATSETPVTNTRVKNLQSS